MNFERESLDTLSGVKSNACDQRRRAVGAPLALVASGVMTSAERCIAWLDNLAVDIFAVADFEDHDFVP